MGPWEHKLGEETVTTFMAAKSGKSGLQGGERHLVRFRVAELVAAGGYENRTDRFEVIRTGKGALLLRDNRGFYTEFGSIEEVRDSLDIQSESQRQLFAALGGDITDVIPEI